MPTEYWRSPETIDRLNRLERPGFAVEFLRRNAHYRRDFARTQRQIARASVDAETARVGSRSAMGVALSPTTRAFRSGSEPVTWLPELSPGTLILEPAPSGFDPARVARSQRQLGSIVADDTDDEGRELVIVDGSGELHIRLQQRSGRSARRAILLPLGDSIVRTSARCRICASCAGLRGQRISLLPAALRLTPQQKRRLVQLLHAFDIHDVGGGPRDVAEKILRSEHAQLPSVEWKDSHARRTANRLIHDSIALVERGYLKLLRGG